MIHTWKMELRKCFCCSNTRWLAQTFTAVWFHPVYISDCLETMSPYGYERISMAIPKKYLAAFPKIPCKQQAEPVDLMKPLLVLLAVSFQ